MSQPDPSDTETLTRSALRAGRAVSVMLGAEYFIVFLRTLVLSRLLEPRELGLIGMAFIVISITEVLSQTGFSRALVQMPQHPQPFLNTVWTVSAARGLALAMLVALLSPAFGMFFREPAVVPVLQAVGVVMFLRGLQSPRWYLLERELRPARLHLPRVCGLCLDLVLTTTLAIQWRSVWAMVFGMLSGGILEVFLTYVVAPFRPRPTIDREHAARLYRFGKHVFRYDLLNCLVEQADRLCVGRFRPTSEMGLYSFAVRLAHLPAQSLLVVIVRVAFPAFSRIQGDPLRIRDALSRLLGLITVVVFPLATGLAVTAPLFVPLVFGQTWNPVVPAFQLLCFSSATNLLQSVLSTVASGIGNPRLAVHAAGLRLAVMLLLIPATLWYGIGGAATVVLASGVVSCLFMLLRVTHSLETSVLSYRLHFLTPMAGSAVMAMLVLAARLWLGGWPTPLLLALSVLLGAACYAAVVLALERRGGTAMASSVISALRGR